MLDLANREDRILVTFDKDFGELIVEGKVRVKGLILLRFTPKSSQQIARRLWQILTSEIPLESSLFTMKEYIIRFIRLKY